MSTSGQTNIACCWLLAILAFLCGLVPQLLLLFSLNYITNWKFLLVLVYVVLFAAMLTLALGTHFFAILLHSGARPGQSSLSMADGAYEAGRPVRGGKPKLYLPKALRLVIFLEALALLSLWYYCINPFSIVFLLQSGQYVPVFITALLMFLALLLFALVFKRLFRELN